MSRPSGSLRRSLLKSIFTRPGPRRSINYCCRRRCGLATRAGALALRPDQTARLARLGLKRGWPDLLIAYDKIFGIEIKRIGGQLSKTRTVRTKRGLRILDGKDMFPRLLATRAFATIATVHSVDEMLAQLRRWASRHGLFCEGRLMPRGHGKTPRANGKMPGYGRRCNVTINAGPILVIPPAIHSFYFVIRMASGSKSPLTSTGTRRICKSSDRAA